MGKPLSILRDIGEISVSENLIRWTIPKFYSEPYEAAGTWSPTFCFRDMECHLSVSTKGFDDSEKGMSGILFYKKHSPGDDSLSVRFRVMDSREEILWSGRAFHFHLDNSHSSFVVLMKQSVLDSWKQKVKSEGQLIVLCELVDERNLVHTSTQTEPEGGTDKLTRDLEELLLSGKNSDVTLSVKGREFKIHRCILAVRSPAFSTRFQHHTEGKVTRAVEIEDADPATFADLLHFLYTGSVAKISRENALDLYAAADRYQILELKSDCLNFMKKNMTVENFCSILDLSLQYEEKELTKIATEFFVANGKEIILTLQWQTFIRENPHIGNELFIKLVGATNKQ